MITKDWYDIRFDPYLTRVGRITVLWFHLELSINEAIWELANTAVGPGACITTQIIALGSRTRALIALVSYRHGDKDLIKNLNIFSDNAEGLARQRNRYVHDTAYIGLDTGKLKRLEIKTEKELSFKYEEIDLKEMDSLVEKIKKCIDDFEILYKYQLFPRFRHGRENSSNNLSAITPPVDDSKPIRAKSFFPRRNHFWSYLDFFRGRASLCHTSVRCGRIIKSWLSVCQVHSCRNFDLCRIDKEGAT
jgi:hypothetical protein